MKKYFKVGYIADEIAKPASIIIDDTVMICAGDGSASLSGVDPASDPAELFLAGFYLKNGYLPVKIFKIDEYSYNLKNELFLAHEETSTFDAVYGNDLKNGDLVDFETAKLVTLKDHPVIYCGEVAYVGADSVIYMKKYLHGFDINKNHQFIIKNLKKGA